MRIVRSGEREPFTTLDGSEVRELAHPRRGDGSAQSLAEAVVPAGSQTVKHLHRTSEEIYLFTAGRGEMELGQERAPVAAGDLVVIPPGTPHRLHNPGPDSLVLLCACSPPYSDEDTELLER